MGVHEKYPKRHELIKSPILFANLIITKFCGDEPIDRLPEMETEFLQIILKKINEQNIDYRQFNEILLLLNQDTVSSDYFEFCFGGAKISLEQLYHGLEKIRGYCLLCYGNFRYPYKEFRQFNKEQLKDAFDPFCCKSEELLKKYKERPTKLLEIEQISKEDTWLLGYISNARLRKESDLFIDELNAGILQDGRYSAQELDEFRSYLVTEDEKKPSIQKIGLKNTDKCLSWDYMDVYIATSMREKAEFIEVYNFINKVFASNILDELNLRYFDPTQSYCGNPRDKGLVEGLMLKRASCTIYLAQESDTMGKDSELAATLAQGKPVIVYVPQPNSEEYSKKIETYSLDYIKKRFYSLEANGRFDDSEIVRMLGDKYGSNYEEIIDQFLKKYGNYRKQQPYTLWNKKEMEFKKGLKSFETVCSILADVECYHYDKRAETLRGNHPLSLQVVLESGVANGVLVIRNADDCSKLLYSILTNNMEFDIVEHTEEEPNALGITEGYTELIEVISKSPFRVVTHQERLTNSFWNNFWRKS